jgi:hypothetical protein
VFRIHGSLLAIAELILTLSDADIQGEAEFYEVSLSRHATIDLRIFNYVSRSCPLTPKSRFTQISSPSHLYDSSNAYPNPNYQSPQVQFKHTLSSSKCLCKRITRPYNKPLQKLSVP